MTGMNGSVASRFAVGSYESLSAGTHRRQAGRQSEDDRRGRYGGGIGEQVHPDRISRAAAAQNASCAGVQQKDESAYPDPDNGESDGFVLTYGRFRTVDLGDLTWNGELDLMCPTNRIGTVDLYLTSHHGLDKSGSPSLVQASRPRVIVMNNGTRKGWTPEAFAGLQETVDIDDLWQLHASHHGDVARRHAARGGRGPLKRRFPVGRAHHHLRARLFLQFRGARSWSPCAWRSGRT